MSRPFGPTCSLYVPGDRPERFVRAATSGADLIVLDLEDAVAPAAKVTARQHVRDYLRKSSGVGVSVRINAVDSEFCADDLAMLVEVAATGVRVAEVRLPKVERPTDIFLVTNAVPFPVAALIESAVGLVHVDELARTPGLVSVGLGESDLTSELLTDGEHALTYARSRVVVACAAAGLRPPAMAAYPQLGDLDGLMASCRLGRSLGLYGRSAVHPSQIPVISSAFRPGPREIAWARDVLKLLARGGGAARGIDGAMVDAAMRGRAEWIITQAPG